MEEFKYTTHPLANECLKEGVESLTCKAPRVFRCFTCKDILATINLKFGCGRVLVLGFKGVKKGTVLA